MFTLLIWNIHDQRFVIILNSLSVSFLIELPSTSLLKIYQVNENQIPDYVIHVRKIIFQVY